jgi:hypothetical protein
VKPEASSQIPSLVERLAAFSGKRIRDLKERKSDLVEGNLPASTPVPEERVPIIQKLVIQRAGVWRRPVITATQMLESMTENPRPIFEPLSS